MSRPRRLVVDPIACDAHGICAELLPEMIRLDDWGYPMIGTDPVPRELAGHARRAIAACPTLALRLVEVQATLEPPTTRTRKRPRSAAGGG